MNKRTLYRLKACVAVLVAAGAFAQTAAEAAPVNRPLGVEDFFTMRGFTPFAQIALSQDGQLVAYTIDRPPDERQPETGQYTASGAPYSRSATDIWITDTRTGKSRAITDGKDANWGTAWSPNGQLLAFYSDKDGRARLWMWDSETDTLRRVSDAPIRSYGTELQWTPDGKQVLAAMWPQDLEFPTPPSSSARTPEKISRPTVRVFHSTVAKAGETIATASDVGNNLTDLALIDIASGQVRRVAKRVSLVNALISPDGVYVALVERLTERVPKTFIGLNDLKLIALANGETRSKVARVLLSRYGLDISWAPDSRELAYRVAIDANDYFSGDAFSVSVTGHVRQLTKAPHPPFKGRPVWNNDGRFIYFIGDDALWEISAKEGTAREVARLPGRHLKAVVAIARNRDRILLRKSGLAVLVVTGDALKTGLHEVLLQSGQVRTLLEEEKRYVVGEPYDPENLVASSRTQEIVYMAEDAQRPPDLWIAGGDLSKSRQITTLNRNISRVPMGERKIVSWTGRDGTGQQGVLLLPSSYRQGRRYPFVMFVYPTAALPDANTFGSSLAPSFYNLQLLATRGYAVLYAGVEYPRRGEPMKEIADAVLPAVDRVVELNIADPERLAVFGSSGGGYSTLALIVQSTRFKAAMAHVAAGNLLSLYGDLQNSGYSHGFTMTEGPFFKMPGHPWKAREQYIRNSPWFFLDKIETPLLLMHGAEDNGTVVSQANEVYLGLFRLGKPAEYARYAGEGHGFTSLVNQIDATQRYLDWFAFWLKDEEDPDPAKREQYARWREMREGAAKSQPAAAR